MNLLQRAGRADTPSGHSIPKQSVPPSRQRSSTRTRQLLIILLAVNSGAVDALGFIALGGAFSSVMTGNMVLLGVSAGNADAGLARNLGVALLCFVGGCALGARIAGRPDRSDGIWPAPVRTALTVELMLAVVVLAGWTVTGADRSTTAQLGLLGANAVALGLQSSSMQRFGVPGLSTTYLTGTLTSVVSRLIQREPVGPIGQSAALLAGLVFGAFAGGLLALHTPVVAPLLPVLLLTVVVAAPLIIWRKDS